jgi:hypothetical protein
MVTKYENGQQIVDYLFDVTQTTGGYLQRPIWSIQGSEREYIAKSLSSENF